MGRCQAMQLALDYRYLIVPAVVKTDRLLHNDDVDGLITEWTKKRKTKAAVDHLRDADVVCGPVNTIEDIKASPQMQARGMLPPLQHPIIGDIPGLNAHGFPIHFSETPGGYDNPAPLPGQHNEEVLGELGFDGGEIARLIEVGAVATGTE